ncbi:MAG: hypothetical protein ISQ76_06785 [Opitutales bacterium]|nr:hypothetical protein [Opitutales bacterium]
MKNKSGSPLSAINFIKANPVTSCIGANAVGHLDDDLIPSLLRESEAFASPDG